MKKRYFIRVFAVLLTLVMCLSVLPQPANAALIDPSAIGSNTTKVTGKWSDTKFWRSNRYTYPFEFDKTLNSCTGFTLDYEILEVEKGSLSGRFKFEIYVRNTSGNWKSVETFYLNGYKTTVDVKFDDPMSIDAVAVICQKQANFSFIQDLTVRNATYKSTTSKETTAGSSGSGSTLLTGGMVSGSWSDTKFWRNNRSTYPFEFSSDLTRCRGFTLNYRISEVSSGNLDGNFKFAVYVRTTSGKWKYVHEFKMDGYTTSTKVTFDPVSIDAVAVFCLKNANLSYSYTFTVTDPIQS